MSDGYTHGHHESVLRSHRWRTAQNSAAYLLGHLKPGMDLLDVGCGPATLTADLAAQVAPGRVVGIDLAGSVLEEARRTVAETGNVEIRAGDVLGLDFADASFDIVHAHQVLQHLTDPVGALGEMARVCRPGGLVAVRDSDYGAMTWWPLEAELERCMEMYQAVAHTNGAQPDAGRRLLGWTQQAGLADVVPTASVWCFATPEDRKWWGGLWAERVVSSRLAEQAMEREVATAWELAEMAAGWRRWAAAPDGWFSVLHGEILVRVS